MKVDILVDKYIKLIKNTEKIINFVENNCSGSIALDGYPSVIISIATLEKIYNIDLSDPLDIYISKLIRNINQKNRINPSLHYGITGVAYSIRIAAENHPEYIELLNKINKLFLKVTDKKLLLFNQNKQNNSISELDYDLIQGISGNMLYALHNRNNKYDDLIKKASNIIIDLFTLDGMKKYFAQENDWINISLSHGILAPLYLLFLIFKKSEYQSDRIYNILKNSISFYRNSFYIDKYNIKNWEGEVELNSATRKYKNNVSRVSWCYGSIGISKVLYTISKGLGLKDSMKFFYQILMNISNESLEYLINDSPTLCHGYAGSLMIYDSLSKSTEEEKFKQYRRKLMNKIKEFEYKTNEFIFKNYDYINNNIKNGKHLQDDIGLLSGTSGIILSLANTDAEEDLPWKELFLM